MKEIKPRTLLIVGGSFGITLPLDWLFTNGFITAEKEIIEKNIKMEIFKENIVISK